jgi:phosphoglucomutase
VVRKERLGKLSADAVTASTLAGDPITARLTHAPGNNASIGGLNVITANGCFSARPSGIENIYKIYAESFKNASHLEALVSKAQKMVNNSLRNDE